jgi:hypothetical protein
VDTVRVGIGDMTPVDVSTTKAVNEAPVGNLDWADKATIIYTGAGTLTATQVGTLNTGTCRTLIMTNAAANLTVGAAESPDHRWQYRRQSTGCGQRHCGHDQSHHP